MKSIFKLIPAALAVFALASCSSDDLLQVGDKAPEQNLEQGDLIITYDPLDNAVTRGYRQGDFSMTQNRPMVYAENDVFKVYDPDMFKYEAYKYNYNGQGNAFFKSNNVTITDPQFVLFPGDKVQRGYYDSEDDCTYAEIAIPRIIKYDAASEMFIDDANTVTGYAYNLPMLGIANPLAGGKMGASKMRHMTAILKIDLENVFGNASWLRLTNQAGKVMSGTIVAKLDVSTEEARKAVKLDPSLNKSDLITYPDMYIDLRNVPSPKSVIFIPIIDGLTEADNIKLEYTAYPGDLDETPGSGWVALIENTPANAVAWAAATTEQKWVDTGMEFPGINFTKNNLYEGSNVFKFDNMSPNKITKLLGQYSETTQNINIALNKDLAVDDNSAKKDGFEILLPTLTNNKDITISLTENFTSITQGANPATKLVIANAEGQDFTGKFTLNVADKLPASTALNIEVNVPNADIVLLGDFDNIDAKNLNLIAAKSVTIGAADAAAGSTKVTDGKLKLAALGDNVKAFTIAKSATVDASTNNVTAGANTAAITINGALTGNVQGGKSTATIDVNGSVTGSVTASNDVAAVDNTITVGEGAVVGNGIVGNDANVKVTVNGEVTAQGISVGKKNTEVTISATGKVLAAGITSTSEQENVINIAGPVTGNVTSNPATITQYASKKTDVNISGIGRVSGNVNLEKNLLGKLSITAVPTDNGSTDKIVTGNVTTGGFVTINLTAATDGTYKSGEGVAIGGTLTMTGATKELKLIQGYVNEIVANVNNAGSWENKFIALTLNDANEGFAAFAKLTETSGYVKYTESVWNGQYPTNAAYKLTNAGTPVSTEKSLYWAATDKAMFTATQLAYYAVDALATNIALFNDIDMKSKEFKCLKAPTASIKFFGRIKETIGADNNHKISNLKLTNKEVVSTKDYAAPIGLFIQATNNLEVTCLDLVNVEAQTDLMPNKDGFKMNDGVTVVGVGALVGSATAKVTANYVNVTLKNQNFGYTKTGADAKQFINVGGLIGYAAGGADIQNSTVKGAPISGYRYLGGLIGQATTDASEYKFTADETDVTFNLTTANTQTMDSWFGAIGGFIGTCTAKPEVTLVGSDNKAAAIDDTKNPYWSKMYVSSTSTADGRFFNLTRHQNFLGFSGRASGDTDFGFGTVTINGSAWTVPAVVPYTTTPVGNVLYHFTTEHSF